MLFLRSAQSKTTKNNLELQLNSEKRNLEVEFQEMKLKTQQM